MMLLALAALVSPPAVAAATRQPSVSIIMPTNGRPDFVRRAMAMVAEQDYPAHILQVVVVDDSPSHMLLEGPHALPRVDYIVLKDQRSVGEKRNIAVNHSVGEVIMHWDDDDIYSTQRVRAQVRPIANDEADMSLLEHQAIYFIGEDELLLADMPWKEVREELPCSWPRARLPDCPLPRRPSSGAVLGAALLHAHVPPEPLEQSDGWPPLHRQQRGGGLRLCAGGGPQPAGANPAAAVVAGRRPPLRLRPPWLQHVGMGTRHAAARKVLEAGEQRRDVAGLLARSLGELLGGADLVISDRCH